MSHHRSWLRGPLAIAVVGLLLLAACSGTSPSPTASADASQPAASHGEAVEGFVSIHGSSTVEPISSKVAEDFAALNPGFDYEVGDEGTGDGFANFFCTGDSDISDASRKIKDEEAAACADAHLALASHHPLAYLGKQRHLRRCFCDIAFADPGRHVALVEQHPVPADSRFQRDPRLMRHLQQCLFVVEGRIPLDRFQRQLRSYGTAGLRRRRLDRKGTLF